MKFSTLEQQPPKGAVFDASYNNCSGKPALFAASVEVMEQLGWLDEAQREALKPWRAQPITDARSLLVGERTPIFNLQTP